MKLLLLLLLSTHHFLVGDGTAKTRFKSYLSDRQQYVKIDEVKSSIQSFKTGVPQDRLYN